jgi:hypothetical protein
LIFTVVIPGGGELLVVGCRFLVIGFWLSDAFGEALALRVVAARHSFGAIS